jgi:hypothetical protein
MFGKWSPFGRSSSKGKEHVRYTQALADLIHSADNPASIATDRVEALTAQFRLAEPLSVHTDVMMLIATGRHAEALAADIEVGKALIAKLGWTGDNATALLQRLGESLVEGCFDSAVADRQITAEEEAKILAAANRFQLSAEVINAVGCRVIRPLLNSEYGQALADGKLSPDEEARIAQTMRDLKVDAFPLHADDAALVQQAREQWQVEHGTLPVVTGHGIGLQRGEVAHYVGDARLVEDRTRTTSTTYRGPRFRVPIVRGFSYNFGSSHVTRKVENYRHLVGDGRVVVTNKRLVFSHPGGAVAVPREKITEITPYIDGARIIRVGKPLEVQLNSVDRRFAIILQRVVYGL